MADDLTGSILIATAIQAFVEGSREVKNWALTRNQQARVENVLTYAEASLRTMGMSGTPLRTDGFFARDPRGAAEAVEGVLLAATTTTEHRKLPYLGNLLASIACGDVSADGANLLITEANGATWLEMKILALFSGSNHFDLTYRSIVRAGADPHLWPVVRTFKGLGLPGKDYLESSERKDHSIEWGLSNEELDNLRLTDVGQLLSDTMGLRYIPADDLDEIYRALINSPD